MKQEIMKMTIEDMRHYEIQNPEKIKGEKMEAPAPGIIGVEDIVDG